jgi:HlyD family secretion protein
MIPPTTRGFRFPVRSGLVPLAAIAFPAACLACGFLLTRKARPAWEGLPAAAVRRTSFDVVLTASGVAQSSRQTVVRCKLENLRIRSRGGGFSTGGASTILEIIPNGTMVKEGDVLCELDASEYKDLEHPQALRVAQHHAEMVQTDEALQSAELALREYSEGLFHQDVQGMEGSVALAESELKRASDRLAWSERMEDKGYASLAQVASDRTAVLRATNQLREARTQLDLYRATRPRR